MAKSKNLAAMLAVTAPKDQPQEAAAGAGSTGAPSGEGGPAPTRQTAVQGALPQSPAVTEKQTKVRSTLDLPRDQHAEFQRWAVDASLVVGRSVRGQQVLRALVAKLLDDPDLSREITEALRNQ